jgi:hypothetical protein
MSGRFGDDPIVFRYREVRTMSYVEHMPVIVGAIQYSLAYLLCGGGIVGAIAIFFGAKALGK